MSRSDVEVAIGCY